MTVGSFLYVLVTAATSLLGFVLSFYASRRHHVHGANTFTWMMLAYTQGASMFFLLSITPPDQRDLLFVISRLRFLGLGSLASLYALFVIEFTGRLERMPRWAWVALFAVPSLTQVVIWFFPHTLMYQAWEVERWQGITIERLTYGPWFWVHIAHSLLAMGAVALPLLISHMLHATSVNQRRSAALTITASVVFVVFSFSAALGFAPTVNLTPVGGGILSVLMTVALFRHRMLGVLSIAYDAVFQGMHDAVVVFNRDDEVVQVNLAAETLLGQRQEQLMGRPATALFPRYHELVARSTETPDGLFELCTPLGKSTATYEARLSPLSRGEQTVGRLLVLHDITARKQAEQERERLIHDLNAYAHTVAHDLKNPLGLIRGFAELMLRDDPDPKQERHTERIINNTRKMQQIIDELLLLATVREREQVPLAALDMGHIVQETLERFKHEQAEIVLPSAWAVACGYGPWVEEVWANYISNALKYGGTPPRLQLGCTAEHDGQVRFWISDNGRGIPTEAQATLFGRFSGLEDPTASGHGLGLSIVQRIVERLGGRVGVESEVGKGSTFYFTLPTLA